MARTQDLSVICPWRVIELYQGLVVLSKGIGKATSFVAANFTRVQLRRLPADGRHTQEIRHFG